MSDHRELRTKLVVGLGNPGPRYEGTRHNVGFMVIDALVSQFRKVRQRRVHRSDFFEARHGGRAVLCLKPGTYMNRSGEPTAVVIRDLELERSDVLVVHDDLDLPLGKLRFKRRGGSGGHLGIEDLLRNLGDGFQRLRLGIGRSEEESASEEFVLEQFSSVEQERVRAALGSAVEGCICWLSGGIQKAMNEFNADSSPAAGEETNQHENDESGRPLPPTPANDS